MPLSCFLVRWIFVPQHEGLKRQLSCFPKCVTWKDPIYYSVKNTDVLLHFRECLSVSCHLFRKGTDEYKVAACYQLLKPKPFSLLWQRSGITVCGWTCSSGCLSWLWPSRGGHGCKDWKGVSECLLQATQFSSVTFYLQARHPPTQDAKWSPYWNKLILWFCPWLWAQVQLSQAQVRRGELLSEVKNGTCSLLLASKLVKSFHTIQIHLPLQNKSISSPGYWECWTALNRVLSLVITVC